ncbi:hypothetical protein BZA05DRAFT_399118 [Tricharina praecox]|uniref:uncharacterized protein n=1 Tax=Tricharina praecox TaxID=43433 RepID=UPI0022211298|nr:uncharacterized protein BZA05DRAFT_399118 [Tricharina praecox]KAI5850894.1 hypothetical protein BZA05DRAFT_399118 [Tricharina praecox]
MSVPTPSRDSRASADTPDAREYLATLVHTLSDIELALLLCLVADRHCILTTEAGYVATLEEAVEITAQSKFALAVRSVQCVPEMTLEEFVAAVTGGEERRGSSEDVARQSTLGIPNVLVLCDLESAGQLVQAQVLELMRTRKITTTAGTTVVVPERFLIIALMAKMSGRLRLLSHLQEQFFISHHHSPPDSGDGDDDDASYTETDTDSISYNRQLHTRPPTASDTSSLASVVIRKYPSFQPPPQPETPPIPAEIITETRALAADVCVSTEIRRYLLDIIVFLRMHRAVRGGVTAQATVDFELLVRCLAPLHNLDFATPALVSLAAFKVYAHRIALATSADDERSTLWGSSKQAAETYLARIDVEAVIEDVLAGVKAPV